MELIKILILFHSQYKNNLNYGILILEDVGIMRSRKRKLSGFGKFLLLLFLVGIGFLGYSLIFNKGGSSLKIHYLKSLSNEVTLYNEKYEEVKTEVRGKEVSASKKEYKKEEEVYRKIRLGKDTYFVKEDNLADTYEGVVAEKEIYVRTPATIYKEKEGSKILSSAKKGEKLEITGFDTLNSNGSVNKYQVKVKDDTGYIYGKYLVMSEEDAQKNYDYNGSLEVHEERGDYLGGGSAINLDFYPVEKPKFENNVMPDEVRAVYLNAGVLEDIDEYISFAKESGINAFVIDIKDDTAPGYASKVMQTMSPTSYEYALNTFEEYQSTVKKLKEEGFYLIGRITTFKDSYYINDHPEDAILDNTTNSPYRHDGSYWPSAFKRTVWEYDVELAKEAVKEMGFHEIQFDYVRFPDRTYYDEEAGIINFQNTYGEEKAQAIQNFLRYATDEIHTVGAYVAADVFGESAHNYVTGYGQYWSAISNVVDVISGMPYPELFNKYEYGLDEPVWTIPYELMSTWAKSYALRQQALVETPAIMRTWIQAYDATWKDPVAYYGPDLVSKEIKGLYDSGCRNGFIAWNGGSSLSKYQYLSEAFKKEY